MKRLLKCPHIKRAHLPRKIPSCAPGTGDSLFKVASRVQVTYLKEQSHRFFSVFLNEFLKYILNILLKMCKKRREN